VKLASAQKSLYIDRMSSPHQANASILASAPLAGLLLRLAR
jgi:hypothetical protein